ncbi:MAG TPA: hypothetical protein VEH48_00955, partial [Candidatus Nitrosopolaris sp.]|nr:hypothetical protein [Candidatus Nitrosopolaris sp.]
KHIERITKLVGLYSPPITINEMAQSAGEAGSASIGITIKGAKNKLGPIIEPNVTNMVARARKTLKNQPPETLFAPTWKTIVAAETEEPDELRFQDTDRIGHSVLVDDLQPELSGSARRSTVHS